MINKELIKKRFKKSFAAYKENAVIQNYMSTMLLKELTNKKDKFERIFEIGCGIGSLTKKLSLLTFFEELIVNDLVENSLKEKIIFPEKIQELYGDCEEIPFPSNLDLVISNATFQWIEDLPSLLSKIHDSLNPDGILAFTTFGDKNFQQIRALTGKSLSYYKKEDLEKILNENFKILYSKSEIMNIEFDSVHDILNHMKLTGVNSLDEQKWTKKELKDFEGKYNKLYKIDSKLILTYEPLYFLAKINL
jgi:malonyl-CoA O-methyltransferase